MKEAREGEEVTNATNILKFSTFRKVVPTFFSPAELVTLAVVEEVEEDSNRCILL